MKAVRAAYAAGVALLAAGGFCSPHWWLGFIPAGAGLVWAAYDLIDVPDKEVARGDTATATRR